jgi:hypothetical protein
LPTPFTAVGSVDGFSVQAEEPRPGGEGLTGNDAAMATMSARLLADLMSAICQYRTGRPPRPNPDRVRWDYAGPTLWQPNNWMDSRPNQRPLPLFIDQAAASVRARRGRADLPNVVGHADWETQNLRALGTVPQVLHDWDTVAHLPEATIAGAATGAVARNEIPTLAPLQNSAAFMEALQSRRGIALTGPELQVAWAASLWPAPQNARAEFIGKTEAVAGVALAEQAEARLALARAEDLACGWHRVEGMDFSVVLVTASLRQSGPSSLVGGATRVRE